MFFTTKVGPWEMRQSDHVIRMGEDEVENLAGFLPVWRTLFPQQDNLAERCFSVPSTVIRFDYAVHEGSPRVYEIEERPAGLGVTSILHQGFLHRLLPYLREQEDAVGATWAIFVSSMRDGSSDDDIFADAADIPIYRGPVSEQQLANHAWYVRAQRCETNVAAQFTSRSLSSITHEGHKSYGVGLGFWKRIDPSFEPDFTVPFAVKPSSGSRFEEVLLFNPSKKDGAGFATRTKILGAIREGRVHFIQPFHPPEEASHLGEEYRLIRRAYFVWSPREGRYISLGGMWMATPTSRVHGTRDAVSGVLQTA